MLSPEMLALLPEATRARLARFNNPNSPESPVAMVTEPTPVPGTDGATVAPVDASPVESTDSASPVTVAPVEPAPVNKPAKRYRRSRVQDAIDESDPIECHDASGGFTLDVDALI